MSSRKTSPWLWLVAVLAILILGAMTFIAGFGVGFATRSVTAQQVASVPGPSEVGGSNPSSSVQTLPAAGANITVPDNFDLIWEAWDALEKDFYGDLPETPEMAGGIVGGMLRSAQMQTQDDLKREETTNAVIAATLQVLRERYGDTLDMDQLTYGAINGFAYQLGDDYTYLRDPEEAASFNEMLNGSFEGIGARVAEAEGGGVRIVEPFENQPAWAAGIRRDDVIIAVDGKDITKLPLEDAISLIRGPKGSKVVLTIRTEGQEDREIEVVRDRITVAAVEYTLRDDGLAYLKLNEFSEPAAEEVDAALKDLLAQNPTGLILDLRGNPGGYLNTAVNITSQFVPEGPAVIERFKDGSEKTFDTTGDGQAFTIPLVVLVNEGSASASEILAGAIQDSGRGQLIGVTTFGKGLVQVGHELSDGAVMSITTAHWFTPKGRAINQEGLKPDIQVERTTEDIEADRDPQLDRAVEYLLSLGQ